MRSVRRLAHDLHQGADVRTVIDTDLPGRANLHPAHRADEVWRSVKLQISGSQGRTVEREDRRGAVISAAHCDVVEVQRTDSLIGARNSASDTQVGGRACELAIDRHPFSYKATGSAVVIEYRVRGAEADIVFCVEEDFTRSERRFQFPHRSRRRNGRWFWRWSFNGNTVRFHFHQRARRRP